MLPNKLGDKLNYLRLIELDKAHSIPLEGLLVELGYGNKNEFNKAVFCVLTSYVSSNNLKIKGKMSLMKIEGRK